MLLKHKVRGMSTNKLSGHRVSPGSVGVVVPRGVRGFAV